MNREDVGNEDAVYLKFLILRLLCSRSGTKQLLVATVRAPTRRLKTTQIR